MKLLLQLLLLFIAVGVSAQEMNISGTVTDDDGNALIGATVQAKGTNTGTITDIDGAFSLSVSSEINTLLVTYTGYKDLEVNIGGRSNIDIILEEGLTLDEVIVVGYGTQKKSDITGSLSSLSGDGLDKLQVGDPSQLMMGRMAGVRVESNGGSPGAGTNIVIRGVSSLSNSDPLFVIDGMFTDNMDFLNPSDIKSIQVLKDASAAAIYGSRAANGVVIITTNNGEGTEGIKIDFESSYGMQTQIKKLDWLSGAEYADFRNQLADANEADRLPVFNEDLDPTVNTIIDDLAISDAPMSNISAKVYGGSKGVSFNISGNWLKQEGIILASDYDRKTFRANLGIKKGKFELSESLTLSRTFTNVNTIWNLNNNILPTIPLRNPDNLGGFGGATMDLYEYDGNNHIGRSELQTRYRAKDNVLANLGLKYEIADGLSVKLNGGLQYSQSENYYYSPSFFISPNLDANRAEAEVTDRRGKYVSGLIEGTLNYNKKFGQHALDLLAGTTAQKTTNEQSVIWVSDFPSNEIRQVSAANKVVQYGGLEFVSTLQSLFGRVNYNYGGKYFLSGTIRRDGSSRFSKENRFGVFPSLAAAWTVSKENFLADNPVISNLKIRASYGELGSQNISDYAFIPVLNINSDAVFGTGQGRTPGVSQTIFANPNLVWETTRSTNVGLDLGLFDYKLTFTADYFKKVSEDILVALRIPPTSGTNQAVAQNAATMENTGLELSGVYNGQAGALNYNISANITFIQNEVTALGENIAPIAGGASGSSSNPTLTDVGQPIASYFGYQVLGIYQTLEEIAADGAIADPNAQPGDFRYEDVDGDGMLTEADQTFLGSYVPDYEYGFTIDGTFKDFDFNLIFNGVAGNEIWNNGRRKNLLDINTSNVTRDALNYWTPENTDTEIPRIGGAAENNRNSSFYVENGAYFRLRNLQIGYSLPSKITQNIKIRKVRFYGSVQNLFTISDYSGYYPEIGRSQDDELRVVDNNNLLFYAGVDQSAYPQPRVFIFGIQVGF